MAGHAAVNYNNKQTMPQRHIGSTYMYMYMYMYIHVHATCILDSSGE